MSDRIKYPRSWDERDRRKLDAMFAEARTKDLLFCTYGLGRARWFTPDELEIEQKARRFIWTAPNWKLRTKQDRKDAARAEVARAGKAFDEAVKHLAALERRENEA